MVRPGAYENTVVPPPMAPWSPFALKKEMRRGNGDRSKLLAATASKARCW
jgi:hypothetical protein